MNIHPFFISHKHINNNHLHFVFKQLFANLVYIKNQLLWIIAF